MDRSSVTATVVERMCQRKRGMNPLESVFGKRERGPGGRAYGEGMNRGTDVVDEAG